MTAGPIDVIRITTRAFGPLLIAFAGLLAWRTELGLSGAVAGGLLIGLVIALHPLVEGWRAARAALPVGATRAMTLTGLIVIGVAWALPVMGPALAPASLSLTVAIAAIDLADPLLAVGAALTSAGFFIFVLSILIARAPDFSDEAL